MNIIETEYNQVITPSEGYLLAFRNDPDGKGFFELTMPLNRDPSAMIVEVLNDNMPKFIPEYKEDTSAMSVGELQQYIISQTKVLLQEFLQKNPISFNGKKYNVTSESQSHLSSVIKAAEDAVSLGISYQPKWNAVGEVRSDYDLNTLKKLFIEIQKYVLVFVMQQQDFENQILQINDKIELLNFSIKYQKEV